MSEKLAFLHGTVDNASALSKVRGNALVLSMICNKVDEMYQSHVKQNDHAYMIENMPSPFFSFPPSQNLNINMMPFYLFRDESLPSVCKPYLRMIQLCRRYVSLDYNKVAYLTIHESDVPANMTQRRAGLHVESPVVACPDAKAVHMSFPIGWGRGIFDKDVPVDGIYMASSVDGTTQVWDSIIEKHEDVADRHGGIECLRPYLGKGRTLKANELCWFTDRTPHEALPVPHDTHRQFFRLVIGKIGAWYAQHSTANPFGVPPDCPILHTNKFQEHCGLFNTPCTRDLSEQAEVKPGEGERLPYGWFEGMSTSKEANVRLSLSILKSYEWDGPFELDDNGDLKLPTSSELRQHINEKRSKKLEDVS